MPGSTRLYIGNVPFSATEQDLVMYLGADGRRVKNVKLMTDRETGQARGFAFAEMASEDDAADAIEALNGNDFMGRALVVNEARDKPPPRRDR